MRQRERFLTKLFIIELLCALHYYNAANGFTLSPSSLSAPSTIRNSRFITLTPPTIILNAQLTNNNDAQDNKPTFKAISTEEPELTLQTSTADDDTDDDTNDQQPALPTAKTNTVNERLIAEAALATAAELAPKTSTGARFKDAFKYNTDLTDAQRAESLANARDLNGVNPTVTVAGSFFAFASAYGLWTGTRWLGMMFLMNPVGEDAPYAFARAASVFRNGVMGLTSLASGFFLVTGLGIFALGVRVAYGVFTGELDPTPIKRSAIAGIGKNEEDAVMPNVWDLMMNKKPTRKGRGGKSGGGDDNKFGL